MTVTVSTVAGMPGQSGHVDGDAGASQFNWPNDVAIAPDGTAYIADYNNNVIRMLTTDGVVSTYAGASAPGLVDGPRAIARFNNPAYLALDSALNLFVVDWGNLSVRKISTDGTVSTLAGAGAGIGHAGGVTVDANDLVYVADSDNNSIVTITQSGVVTTLTGGAAGFADGPLSMATFDYPNDVHFDAAGNLYVSDRNNCAIRVISPGGNVSTLVGRAGCGYADGDSAHAMLHWPIGIVPSADGFVYVVDVLNQRIRAIDESGNTTTIAGDGSSGSHDGSGNVCDFNTPIDMSADSQGNLYIADRYNATIRKVTFVP